MNEESSSRKRLSELLSEDAFVVSTTASEDMIRSERDPLLANIPDKRVMRECVRRAKVLCHLLFGEGPALPILSQDEQALLAGLRNYPSWHHGVWILQNAAIGRTDAELFDESIRCDAGAAGPVAAAWIRDLASAFAFVVDGDADRAMRETESFYGDGLPFTSARYFAMLKAREEDPDLTSAPRTLN